MEMVILFLGPESRIRDIQSRADSVYVHRPDNCELLITR